MNADERHKLVHTVHQYYTPFGIPYLGIISSLKNSNIIMTLTKQSLLVTALMAFALLAFAATAFGATTYFGGATEADGEVTLVSNTGDADADNDFSGITFDVPGGTTFATLTVLSTDYNVTDDGCMGGAPRFQIKVDTGSGIKNIFAYLGSAPGYNDCDLNEWDGSGDLLEAGMLLDTSQVGGMFYDTYENAVEDYGSYPVVSVQLVVDAGWAAGDSEQTVLVDNVVINDTTYDFTPPPPPPPGPTDKDQCKKGGWQDFTNPSFKNQGQCVSHAQRNR